MHHYLRSMRTIVIGDIHGRAEELRELLSACNFDYENDKLIQLGDLIDRGPDPYGVIEELIKIKNKVLLYGNHEDMFLSFMRREHNIYSEHTVKCYKKTLKELHNIVEDNLINVNTFTNYLSQEHKDILLCLKDRPLYHLDEGRLFVHAGIAQGVSLDRQPTDSLIWDRDFFYNYLGYGYGYFEDSEPDLKYLKQYREIYIGHTPVINYDKHKLKISKDIKVLGEHKPEKYVTGPMVIFDKIYNMDTGAGFEEGYLTAMDINNKSVWQVKIRR